MTLPSLSGHIKTYTTTGQKDLASELGSNARILWIAAARTTGSSTVGGNVEINDGINDVKIVNFEVTSAMPSTWQPSFPWPVQYGLGAASQPLKLDISSITGGAFVVAYTLP